MNLSTFFHLLLIIGFAVIAVVLPALVLQVRRTKATYALCGMVWFIFLAAIMATGRDLQHRAPLDDIDYLRLGAITCFLMFMFFYQARNGRDT